MPTQCRVLPLLLIAFASFSLAACEGDIEPEGTGTATLSWIPPTERADGSPLETLSGYRIVYGEASHSYDRSILLPNAVQTRYVVEGLTEGTWYFAVRAIDIQGLESAPSAEVSKTIGG
jgi:hypothetical protein